MAKKADKMAKKADKMAKKADRKAQKSENRGPKTSITTWKHIFRTPEGVKITYSPKKGRNRAQKQQKVGESGELLWLVVVWTA